MEEKISTCKKGEHEAYFVKQKKLQHLLAGKNLTKHRVTTNQNLDQKHRKTKTRNSNSKKTYSNEMKNKGKWVWQVKGWSQLTLFHHPILSSSLTKHKWDQCQDLLYKYGLLQKCLFNIFYMILKIYIIKLTVKLIENNLF